MNSNYELMPTKAIAVLNVFVLLLSFQTSAAQDLTKFFSTSNAFFNAYVKNGLVDYKAIKDNPKKLNELLDSAEGLTVSKDDSKNYQAFWINAYNLHVIKAIVKSYPVKSPLDIDGFFDQTKRNIGGRHITLNDIENKLLRANFPKEARFHFVLVCAGLGCPPIINKAYLPGTLESQLQTQTEFALNDPNFIRVKEDKVLLSQIFEWYTSDFIQGEKSLIDFVNRYRKEKLSPDLETAYYPYDWTLNTLN